MLSRIGKLAAARCSLPLLLYFVRLNRCESVSGKAGVVNGREMPLLY